MYHSRLAGDYHTKLSNSASAAASPADTQAAGALAARGLFVLGHLCRYGGEALEGSSSEACGGAGAGGEAGVQLALEDCLRTFISFYQMESGEGQCWGALCLALHLSLFPVLGFRYKAFEFENECKRAFRGRGSYKPWLEPSTAKRKAVVSLQRE